MTVLTYTPATNATVALSYNGGATNALAAAGTGTTYYVYIGSTNYTQDTYNYSQAIPTTATITNVRLSGYFRTSSTKATAYYKNVLHISGGSDYLGSEVTNATTSYVESYTDWATNPAGGSWTPTVVNALTAGCTIKESSASYECRAHQLTMAITYTVPLYEFKPVDRGIDRGMERGTIY